MLGQSGIRLHRAETVEQADFLLLATGATVLLSDTAFLDGSWESALAMVRDAHPLVAVLVCADAVDRDFVALAPKCGALGIHWKPLELARLREAIWGAHEVSLERMLWRAEKEYEFRSEDNAAQSVFSEAAK
jgi:DNA-binding NtrC family response regulator